MEGCVRKCAAMVEEVVARRKGGTERREGKQTLLNQAGIAGPAEVLRGVACCWSEADMKAFVAELRGNLDCELVRGNTRHLRVLEPG